MARREEFSSGDDDSLEPSGQLALQVGVLRVKVRQLDETLFGSPGRVGVLADMRQDARERYADSSSNLKSLREEVEERLDEIDECVKSIKQTQIDQKLEKAKIIGAGLVIWAIFQMIVPIVLKKMFEAFMGGPAKP